MKHGLDRPVITLHLDSVANDAESMAARLFVAIISNLRGEMGWYVRDISFRSAVVEGPTTHEKSTDGVREKTEPMVSTTHVALRPTMLNSLSGHGGRFERHL